MNADAAKWLADYEKVIPFDSLKLKGNEFVLAYDINNPEMYEKIWRNSGSLLIMDDADFFSRWQKKLEIDILLKKGEVPTLAVCHSIEDAIACMNGGNSNVVVCLEIDGKDDEFCREFVNEWESKKMKKFDLIVGNPPYTKGLDLKIHRKLEECLKDDGKIIFVHPSKFAITHKEGVREIECYKVDLSKMESIRLFWANAIFNIGLFVPACVSIWKKDKNTEKVLIVDEAYTNTEYMSDPDKIHMYGEKYKSFVAWIHKNVNYFTHGSIGTVATDEVKKKFGVELSSMRGTPPRNGDDSSLKDDFFTIIPKEDNSLNAHLKNKGFHTNQYNRVFSFDTEEERKNFLNYLKTKAVRFILSLSKTTQAIVSCELNQIPWLDFTKPYSDKDLCQLWNIDDKLWKFIDEHIPAYYPDWHFDGIY